MESFIIYVYLEYKDLMEKAELGDIRGEGRKGSELNRINDLRAVEEGRKLSTARGGGWGGRGGGGCLDRAIPPKYYYYSYTLFLLL